MDGFGPKRRFGVRKICGLGPRGTGVLRTSELTGGFCGSGLAHFEVGGDHFPIPAGVDGVSGDGGAVCLLLEKPHPVGCALTCARNGTLAYEVTTRVCEWIYVLTALLVAVTFVLTWMRLERENTLPPRRLCMVAKLTCVSVSYFSRGRGMHIDQSGARSSSGRKRKDGR